MAIDLDDKHIKAFSNRAFCFERKGEFERALEDYKKCTKIDKDNLNVLQSFAALQAKVGGKH